MIYVLFTFSLLTCVYLVPLTLKKSKQYWDVKDTPTVSPGGAIIGICEVNGRAEMKVEIDLSQSMLLHSPITNTECVWYSVTISRLVDNGKDPYWGEFHSESVDAFSICDEYDKINVFSKNAFIEATENVVDQPIAIDVLLKLFPNSALENIVHSDDKLAVTENVIKYQQAIFAHGNIDCAEDSSQLEYSSTDTDKVIVSVDGEKSIVSNRKLVRVCIHIATLVFMFMTLSSGFEAFGKDVSVIRQSIAFYILLALYFVIFNYFRTYNRYIRFTQRINSINSTIGIVENRRKNLIPDIVDAVKQASAHELGMQQLVSELRNINEDKFSNTLMSLSEKYSEINVSSNFLQLQNELVRTEEKIAMAKSYRNDAVLFYNNYRNTFSGMILKSIFKKIE